MKKLYTTVVCMLTLGIYQAKAMFHDNNEFWKDQYELEKQKHKKDIEKYDLEKQKHKEDIEKYDLEKKEHKKKYDEEKKERDEEQKRQEKIVQQKKYQSLAWWGHCTVGFLANIGARNHDPITRTWSNIFGIMGSYLLYKICGTSLWNCANGYVHGSLYAPCAQTCYELFSPLFAKETRAASMNAAREFSRKAFDRGQAQTDELQRFFVAKTSTR